MNYTKLLVETKTYNENTPFLLYSDCFIVKGARRSIIYDTGRINYHYIPNSLYALITEHNGNSINYVKSKNKKIYHDTIDEYFNFLFENELIFFSNQPELFPKINLEWDEPSLIIQTIIDFNKNSLHNLDKIANELSILNCKDLQLRFYDNIEIKKLESILSLFNDSTISGIEIIIPYDKNASLNNIKSLQKSFPRLVHITIHGSPKKIAKKKFESSLDFLLQYIEQGIENEKSCGVIDISYFSINIKMFTESQKHNTCLNRKISIDVNGEIKNCPSMQISYGNIKDTTLKEALEKAGFKDVWYIHKDQIEVCKDCEFRHICTDCRAHLKEPSNIYSQPKKCDYNPYVAKWEGQEGYISVEKYKNE